MPPPPQLNLGVKSKVSLEVSSSQGGQGGAVNLARKQEKDWEILNFFLAGGSEKKTTFFPPFVSKVAPSQLVQSKAEALVLNPDQR